MRENIDNSLYDDPNIAQFYDSSNLTRADFDYCIEVAKNCKSVLDLGCGTGELATILASECEVVGVDPAEAMLEIAADRYSGNKVTWIVGDARTVRLDAKFDLVVLTGHVFQVFLTREDQLRVLKSIAEHLNPLGKFVFDSRNPNFNAPKSREKTNGHRFFHNELGEVQMWNQSIYDEASQILRYENGYEVLRTGKCISQKAQILYTSKDTVSQLLEEAGLVAEKWLGDWNNAPFYFGAKEIIPVGRRK